jgi:hypothetical protein
MKSFGWLRSICAAILVAITVPALAQQGTAHFDHFKTGFPLTGGHMTVECVTCHINGRLQGTPRQCAACHNGTLAPGMPTGHIPVQTSACDTCHRNPGTFGPGTRMNHNGIISGCATCHSGQTFLGVSPVSKSANHMATTGDCVQCHRSYVSFLGGAGSIHTGVTSGCSNCHNGSTATGKPANHLPSSQDCSVCHTSTTAFGPNTQMKHTGITGSCSTCHTGQSYYGITPVSMPATGHVPTNGQDCVACHTSTASFAGGKFSHSGITAACSTCHTGQSYYGVTPVSMPATGHIPTNGQDCGTCHKSTSSFTGATYNHSGASAGSCNTCHNGNYKGVMAQSAISNHVPTGSTSCDTCHTSTATGGFASFTMGTTGHSALGVSTSSDCTACHLSATYMSVAAKPANHFPTTPSNQNCAACHTSMTSFLGAPYNHSGSAAGTCNTCHAANYSGVMTKAAVSNHVPTSSASCDACHTSTSTGGFGSFTMGASGHSALGVTSFTQTCTTCHGTGSQLYFNVTAAPAAHYTGNCGGCHTSFTTFTGASGGDTKPFNHIPTSQSCTLCHSAGYSAGLTQMSHSGITGSCATCHNGASFAGVTPVSMPATGHIPTSGQDCVACHKSTASFSGATYTHSSASTGLCNTCHNGNYKGVMAQSAISNHVPTSSASCDTCHTSTKTGGFAAFTMGASGHSALGVTGFTQTCTTCHGTGSQLYFNVTAAPSGHSTGNCGGCHKSFTTFTGASGATTKPSNHIPTSQSCTLCHSAGYSSGLTQMSHSGITGSCVTCHNGASFAGVTPVAKGSNHIATSQDCSLCHKSTTVPGGFATGGMDHTGISAGCTKCHGGTAFQGVTPVSKGSNHVPTTLDCVTCHTSFVGFSTGAMSHTGISTNCASCHGGQSFQNTKPVAKGSNHIPTSLDCSTCHRSTAAFGPNTAMNHSGITSGCATCHSGAAFQGVTPVSKSASGHIPATADCSSCHTSFTSFGGATYNHSGVASGTCYKCHNGTYAGVTSVTSVKNHVATGASSCDICHTGSKATGGFATFVMGNAGHAATSPAAVLSTTNCMTCHNGSVLGTKTFKPHPGKDKATTANANYCGTCHKSFTSDPGH